MAFKFELLANVAGFLKGAGDVEQAVDDVAGSLDDLARDSQTSADKASDALERKFTDALEAVQAEAKETGRKLGNDVHDGTKRAGDGMDDLKDEAKQSARETAASFSDVSDALDLVQEIAANAFGGFGPAGMAAGALAAVGIGLLKTGLDAAKEKADQTKDRVLTLADAIAEVGGDPKAINWAEQLRDVMKEIVDTKEWFEFWQNAPVDRLTDWTAKVKAYGVAQTDVMRAATGDTAALARVNATLDQSIADLTRRQAESMDMNGNVDTSYTPLIEAAQKFKDDVTAQTQAVTDATTWQKAYADATKDLSTAQTEAQKTAEDFSAALTDNLSVADEGLDTFVRGAGVKLKDWNKHLKDATEQGTLDVDAWADEVKRRAKENRLVLDFTADIDTKLSPEALAAFEKLPTDTQAQIAKAYKKGDHKKILQTLEAEAKVTKVTVDTTGVQAQAEKNPVEIPSTVVSTGAIRGTQDAADAAQREANRDSNRIEFKTRIDRDELQRQVNRAAASITPPTVYVNVKAKKEVP